MGTKVAAPTISFLAKKQWEKSVLLEYMLTI
jgi:hypothetical protein